MMRMLFTCDVCGKDTDMNENTRTIRVTLTEGGQDFFEYDACDQKCAIAILEDFEKLVPEEEGDQEASEEPRKAFPKGKTPEYFVPIDPTPGIEGLTEDDIEAATGVVDMSRRRNR